MFHAELHYSFQNSFLFVFSKYNLCLYQSVHAPTTDSQHHAYEDGFCQRAFSCVCVCVRVCTYVCVFVCLCFAIACHRGSAYFDFDPVRVYMCLCICMCEFEIEKNPRIISHSFRYHQWLSTSVFAGNVWQMGGQTDRQMDGRTDERMDGRTHLIKMCGRIQKQAVPTSKTSILMRIYRRSGCKVPKNTFINSFLAI